MTIVCNACQPRTGSFLRHQRATPVYAEGELSMGGSEGDEVTHGLWLTLLRAPTATLESISMEVLRAHGLAGLQLWATPWMEAPYSRRWRRSTRLPFGYAARMTLATIVALVGCGLARRGDHTGVLGYFLRTRVCVAVLVL